jgi:hypothetical protein
MGSQASRWKFAFALFAIAGLSIGSLALSNAVSVGAETDVGSETDVQAPAVDLLPTATPMPTTEPAPPAAPIDDSGDDGNSGQVGADANQLPSAGSGGYLNADGGAGDTTFYILALFALSLVAGGAAVAYSRSK